MQIGDYTEGYFKNLGNGIFERRDKKTEKITGIAIHSFKKRTLGLKERKISLPFKVEITS